MQKPIIERLGAYHSSISGGLMTTFKRNIIITISATIALIAIFLTVIIANISTISDPYSNELIFEKSTFVGQWPFTVDSVVVRCDDINDKSVVSIITFTGEGYIINADSNVDLNEPQKKILSPEHAIWLDTPIITENPKTQLLSNDIKTPMNDVISAGLKLCAKV